MKKKEDKLVEALASYAHKAWSGWMGHLFSKCSHSQMSCHQMLPDVWVYQWKRQMKTSYSKLSEKEKESDRKEARRMIAIFKKHRGDR